MPIATNCEAHAQDLSPAKPINSIAINFRQRDQWSRMLPKIHDVNEKHRDVLRTFALCARVDKNGNLVIDTTYLELAGAAGCSERTAYRVIANAEEIGIIRKLRHSDGRVSNVYQLVFPKAAAAVKTVPKAPEKPQYIQRPTLPEMPPSKVPNPVSTWQGLKAKRKVQEVRKEHIGTASEIAPHDLGDDRYMHESFCLCASENWTEYDAAPFPSFNDSRGSESSLQICDSDDRIEQEFNEDMSEIERAVVYEREKELDFYLLTDDSFLQNRSPVCVTAADAGGDGSADVVDASQSALAGKPWTLGDSIRSLQRTPMRPPDRESPQFRLLGQMLSEGIRRDRSRPPLKLVSARR